MADLELYKVDLDTPQPGGRLGETPRAAFMKYNDLIDELNGGVGVASVVAGNNITIDSTDPANPIISGTAAILTILGEVATEGELPATGNTIGDSYIIGENLWVWTDEGWFDAGTYVGPQGEKGDKGWTPLISLILDDERIVMEVYDWVGGEGTKPTETGYVSESGLVSDISLAQNIRGPAGAGDGNVNTTGSVANNHIALFDGATGLLIKSGGLLAAVATSGSYNDLTDTPDLTVITDQVDLNTLAIGTLETKVTDIQTQISGKNKIINGNFDIWQRGTSQTSSGYGSADRWRSVNIGTTKTTSRQNFENGQITVPDNPKHFIRTVVSSVSGTNNFCTLQQRVEGVHTLSGQTTTLSFWAKADSPKELAVEFTQSFGSGGSPSATLEGINPTKVNLTTTWQKFEITTTLPSISGEVIGTAGNDFLSVGFWFDAGSSFNTRTVSLGQQSGTFDIAQVQLEKGSIATDFEQRPIAEEMALCQRYYWQGGVTQGSHFLPWTSGAAFFAGQYDFITVMRVNPTAAIITSPVLTRCSNLSLSASTTSIGLVVDPTANAYRAAQGIYEADAEL